VRYRAILNDPADKSQDRPKQILGNSRKEIDRWTAAVLEAATATDASVSIYEWREQQIAIVLKPKP